MSTFENKVVFVTGAASGIGHATAAYFMARGAQVFATDLNTQGLTQAVSQWHEQGLSCVSYTLDVSDPSACENAMSTCLEQFGRLDVLCNVAGIGQLTDFASLSIQDWERVLRVNTSSVFYLCKFAMPHLLAVQGNIVNVASTAGVVGLPYNAGYCASKGAVVQFSKALAVEYADRHVRVNVVCPGAVATPLAKQLQPPPNANMSLYQRMYPLVQPVATPNEIAHTIGYLASDDARFVTGTVQIIDGGQTAI